MEEKFKVCPCCGMLHTSNCLRCLTCNTELFPDELDRKTAEVVGRMVWSCNRARFFNGLTAADLRPEVLAFAHEMEKQLRANEHKGGWKDCRLSFLMEELFRNYSSISTAHLEGNRQDVLRRRASNVANFAMMIADNFGNLMGNDQPEKKDPEDTVIPMAIQELEVLGYRFGLENKLPEFSKEGQRFGTIQLVVVTPEGEHEVTEKERTLVRRLRQDEESEALAIQYLYDRARKFLIEIRSVG